MGAFENGIQTSIMNYLKAKRAYALNIHGNEYQSGVPDIICCYRGLFIGIEVKGPDGSLSSIQKVHLQIIQKSKGLGVAVRSVKRVQEIIKCIDSGGDWSDYNYRP